MIGFGKSRALLHIFGLRRWDANTNFSKLVITKPDLSNNKQLQHRKPYYEPFLCLRGNWDLGFLCNSVPHYKIFTATWKAGFRAHHHHFSSSLPSSLYSRFYLCLEIRIGAAKFQVKVHHQSHFPLFPGSALVYFLHDLQLSSIYDWLRLPGTVNWSAREGRIPFGSSYPLIQVTWMFL